jgi:PhnB protein
VSTAPMKLQTYLNYGGNREQALRFYEKQLDGKITRLLTWDQMPGVKDLPPDRQKAILHARITIGEIELMASDVPPEQFQPMRSVYLSLSQQLTGRRTASHLALRRRPDLHAAAGIVFCVSL